MTSRRSFAAVLLLVTSLFVGCSTNKQEQTPTLPPASTLPSGWQLYKPAGYHFQIAAPGGWVSLTSVGVLTSPEAKRFIESNPYLAKQVARQQRKARQGGVPLILFDLSEQGQKISDATGGYVPGLQLEVQRLRPPKPDSEALNLLADYLRRSLPTEGHARNVVVTRTTLASLPAIKATFVSRDLEPNGPVDKAGLDYVLVQDGVVWGLYFDAPQADSTAYEPVFERIADSFKLDDPGVSN